jgi:hypothetical protein
MIENPATIHLDRPIGSGNNPGFIHLSQSPDAYRYLFSRCLDVVGDTFDIDSARTSRYGGIINTFPRIAPGLEQPWKPGSPDVYQRLLAFCQTIRHRCVVEITTGQNGGYFVDVKVFRELEDLQTPARSTAGEATVVSHSTIERQPVVIAPDQYETNWIPTGRDIALEQAILERITRLDSLPGEK